MDGGTPCDLLLAHYDTSASVERAIDLLTEAGAGDAMYVRPWTDLATLEAFGAPPGVARRVLTATRAGRFALLVRVDVDGAARARALLAETTPSWMEQDHALPDV